MAGDHRRIVNAVTIISAAAEAGIVTVVITVRASPAIIKRKERVTTREGTPSPKAPSAEARISETPTTRREVTTDRTRGQPLIRSGQRLSSGLAPIVEFVFVAAG